MVSKSKELGKFTLILISTGSTSFQFLRLTSILNNIDKNKYKILSEFTSPAQFIDHIKKADKIIIHGGPVTIFLVVRYAKFMPLIIPRLSKYKEHVDDHQLFFVKFLRDRLPEDQKKYFVTEEKINNIINLYLKEKNVTNSLSKYLFLPNKKNQITKNLDFFVNQI
jgi:hypothetical protein